MTNNKCELLAKCGRLAFSPSIPDCLEEEIRKHGFAGSANVPKLVYLTFLTGVLDKPVSLVLKGPSWVEERGEARHHGLLKGLALRKLTSYPLPGATGQSVLLQICPADRVDRLAG